MYSFSDLKRDKSLRITFEAFFKRKGWIGIYDFALKKQGASAEMKYLLRDISKSEDLILGRAGEKAKRIAQKVQQEIAADAQAGKKKVASDGKRLESHPDWQKMRTTAKKVALDYVKNETTMALFLESKEFMALEKERDADDWKRISLDFEKEFALEKGALAEFKRIEDISEARFKKAMEKLEAEQADKRAKKKKKTPSFSDFKKFIMRKKKTA